MEVADVRDLAVASEQGTILRIKAYGQQYGSGGYESFYFGPEVAAEYIAAVWAVAICCLVVLFQCRKCCGIQLKGSPPMTKSGYKEHPPDDMTALSNKLQAMACTCDVGPFSTEVRVMVRQSPMYRD